LSAGTGVSPDASTAQSPPPPPRCCLDSLGAAGRGGAHLARAGRFGRARLPLAPDGLGRISGRTRSVEGLPCAGLRHPSAQAAATRALGRRLQTRQDLEHRSLGGTRVDPDRREASSTSSATA
jgi:hypothetical protein